MESNREMAKRLVEDYHRRHPKPKNFTDEQYRAIVDSMYGMFVDAVKQPRDSPLPAPLVEIAIEMEKLNARDRDWLERIGIKL
jgi:hypothetical protein